MTTQVPATASELVEELRRVCAEAIEIPLDKVTEDADLAADLGVDSLTMDEFLVQVLEHYGMAAKASSIPATSYPTIGALAGLIQRLNSDGNAAEIR